MSQTWPVTLPTTFILDEFNEKPPNTAIRTKMDVGPAKIRRRSTAGVRPIVGKMVMTAAQIAILDTFYVTTTGSGAESITGLNHPRTGDAATWRFVSEPSYTPLGGDNWGVVFNMEILP